MKDYTEALIFKIVEENYENFVANFDQTFQVFFGTSKYRNFIRELLNKVLFECKLEKNYIHLMVENPKEYIEDYSKIKPEYMTFHYEIGNPLEWIKLIQSKGIKAGMSIKPSTTVEEIKSYLPYLDLVLVMSVEPGLGGQVFLESTYLKIEELVQYKKEYNNSFQIEVDGGINSSNIENLKKCDIIVVGSFITKGVFKERVEELKKCCNLEET